MPRWSTTASARIDADRACLLYGHVRIEGLGRANEQLGGVRAGDAAAYKYATSPVA